MYSADQRPDPNALLKAARREARGCLRVFLEPPPALAKPTPCYARPGSGQKRAMIS